MVDPIVSATITQRFRIANGLLWSARLFQKSLVSSLLLVLLCACTPFVGQVSTSTHLQVQSEPRACITYVAIGASDTFGTGTTDPTTQSWPVDLAHKIGPGVRLVNLGIPGIHTRDAFQMELPVALDAHPDVLTVWLAVNDLVDKVPVDQYQRDLDNLLILLQKGAPAARIAVANVPDLSLLPYFQGTDVQALHVAINAYNVAIRTVVGRHNVVLVDLYGQGDALTTHPGYVSGDGFHLSSSGYAQVAEVFYQTLKTHHI